MPLPDLDALRSGDTAAWDEAFRWLWPAAFSVAQLKLQPYLPAEIEDVAVEALETLVEKVREVKAVEELKSLVASIAHHRAISRLREQFAAKRGAGKTESLQALQGEPDCSWEPADGIAPWANLEVKELGAVLHAVQAGLQPVQQAIVADFFLAGLSYEQIAAKHQVALGTVGVYLKRGLEAMRRIGGRHPQLLKELEAFLR